MKDTLKESAKSRALGQLARGYADPTPAPTPRPWTVKGNEIVKCEAHDRIIASLSQSPYDQPIVKANADLIVRAVNSHAGLLAKVEQLEQEIEGHHKEHNRAILEINMMLPLHAAAPMLLEALRKAEVLIAADIVKDDAGVLASIRAAIAAAKKEHKS